MAPALSFPPQLRSERLLLRRWRPADAAALEEALDASLPELQAWIPWVLAEPGEVEEVRARLARFERSFDAGEEFLYGIRDPRSDRVVGGAGLHPRIGPGALEIGYWIRTSFTGRGYATEAAAMLTQTAFGADQIERVQIRVDVRNAASVAIPRRLGYRLVDTIDDHRRTPDAAPVALAIWEMRREHWVATPGDH